MPSVSVGLVFCLDEGKKGGGFILNQQLNLLQQAEIYTHKKRENSWELHVSVAATLLAASLLFSLLLAIKDGAFAG